MAHEYTLFSHLRTGRTVRAHARARNVFQKFQNVAMRACTLRSQLVAKVRASPNNGFPHEEQIGGTIYLSGTLANVCILTRKPPQIFNLRAHRHTLLDQPGVCIYTYIQGSVTESAWDAPISMRKRKKESTLAEVEVAFNYGRRPPLASIRVPREFFNPQQIRVTRSTDGQRVDVYARECV